MMMATPDSSRFMDNHQHHLGTWDTLDEPIWDTISRDISGIGAKLRHILLPLSEKEIYQQVCKNWDLWGPFIFATYIAFSLNNCIEDCLGYHQSNFSSIFVLLWLANFAVCLNYKLVMNTYVNKSKQQQIENSVKSSGSGYLKHSTKPMSIFQLLCLMGYTLAIPSIGILLMQILSIFLHVHFFERLLITLLFGFIYPIVSCLTILHSYIASERYFLVAYPVTLFFSALSLYMYTFL